MAVVKVCSKWIQGVLDVEIVDNRLIVGKVKGKTVFSIKVIGVESFET